MASKLPQTVQGYTVGDWSKGFPMDGLYQIQYPNWTEHVCKRCGDPLPTEPFSAVLLEPNAARENNEYK